MFRFVIKAYFSRAGCRLPPALRLWAAALAAGGELARAADPGPRADPAQQLGPLVVTGTRTAQRLGETPIRTEMLTAADLRLAAPRNLADAIELFPGIRVENNCQNCGTSEILLLGLEQKYTQILFDGQPLFSGLAGVYGIDQIPAIFIDRIEVVKGGGSAVYGGGAVGGVVNIIGHRPARSGGMSELRFERVQGRPVALASLVLDGVSADGRTTLSAYGQRVRADPVDLNADGFSDLTKKKLEVAGLRFTRKSGAGEWIAAYDRTVEFRRGGNKFDQPDNLADISERVDTRRDAGSLTWAATVTPDFDYTVTGGFALIDRQTFYGGLFGRAADAALLPESAPGAGDNDQRFLDRGYRTQGEVALDEFGYTKNHVTNLEVQANRRWGRHLVSLGGQYYREGLDDVVPVRPFVTDFPVAHDVATGRNLGVFVQDQWGFAPGWQMVLGVRGDRNSELDRAVFSPRVSIKFSPSDDLALRAAFGTGFRAPQAFDEDLHIELMAGNRTKTVQAASLREERSASALLNAEYAPAFARGRLALEATLFLTRLRGTFTNSAVQTDPVTGAVFRERTNGPAAEVGGVELNLGFQPVPQLRFDFGYLAQFARFKQPVVVFDDRAGRVIAERNFLETPQRYGVAQMAWREPRFADLAVSATYTGAMKALNERLGTLNARTRDFVVWNASVARALTLPGGVIVTVTIGAKNLGDARQQDLEAGVNRDPYYLYGPRTPRTFFTSARFEF